MITIVSGFQRCGSSLMLQMLQAGGLCVFHDKGMGYPAFETMLQLQRAHDPSWVEPLDGQALKWLEPQRALPAAVTPELRILWMKRDYEQQARSAVKFLREVAGIACVRNTRHVLAASYRRDEPRVLAAWRDRGRVHVQRFEQLLENPQQAADDVCRFLGLELNRAAMVDQVVERGPACLPNFLELELLERMESRNV